MEEMKKKHASRWCTEVNALLTGVETDSAMDFAQA